MANYSKSNRNRDQEQEWSHRVNGERDWETQFL